MENNGEYYTQELLLMPGYSFVMLDGAHVLEDSFMTGQAIRIANALNSAVSRVYHRIAQNSSQEGLPINYSTTNS